MKARVAAAGIVLLGAAALVVWPLLSNRRTPSDSDDGPADAAAPVAPGVATLAASGRATQARVRRVTIRLVGDGHLVPAGTAVGISSPDGDRIDRERGAFVRREDGATPVFVCDDVRLPPSSKPSVVALVVRSGLASLRVPLDVPRSKSGGWADEFDVTATADLSALATVAGRVQTSSGPGIPDLRVVLLGPRPPRPPAPQPAAPAPRRGVMSPPPPTPFGADSKADDWAPDRPLLGFAETDADGRFSIATTVAVGETIDARVVATVPRSRTVLESRLSAATLLRAGEHAAV